MSKDTNVEWCDSSVNPIMGCEGCELWTKNTRICYAGLLHDMRGGHKGYALQFEKPETFPDRMADAAKWKDLTGSERKGTNKTAAKPWLNALPRTIFVGDMGDLFSTAIKDEYIADTLSTAAAAKQHIWMFLTKRPKRMAELVPWDETDPPPSNLWGMTSITNRKSLPRIEFLKQSGFHVKGLSVEPLLEDIPDLPSMLDGIDWVIVGGTSGVSGIPKTEIAWIERIVGACLDRGLPVFVKQIGSGHGTKGDPKGGWPRFWPKSIQYRQMPLQKVPAPGDWRFDLSKFYAFKPDMFDESSPNIIRDGAAIPHH